MVPPRYLTRFIGRESALVDIGRHLQDKHVRLLSLTGPGGCGKTRLAAELVVTLEEAFEDGLRWVDLVGISDPDLLAQTVSSTLQINLAPGQSPTEGLLGYLQSRNLLLILDNCEHLVTSCAQLVALLLRNCPYLHVLVTSRERLHVAGEIVWPVPPLSFPQAVTTGALSAAELESLAQYPAVQLFKERATAADPKFDLTVENAPAVSEICRRLEGMPLAIELAAARVNLLGVVQIAGRLNPALSLLSDGPRTSDARHQALRDTIDWSYGLLVEPERTLLRRLGVFSGGFTLEAAEYVCAGQGDVGEQPAVELPILNPDEILNLLGSLVSKSLVVVESEVQGRKRFRLLETIRHFALEKLRAVGAERALRDLHLLYFVGYAERAEPELVGAEQLVWIDRVSADYDNFQAALSWAIENAAAAPQSPYAEWGWTLAARLFWYWNATDQLNEGRQWLEKTLAVGVVPEQSPAGATAMARAGNMAWIQGDFEMARERHEASLELWEALDDPYGRAAGYNILARIALYRGDAPEAITFFEKSAPLARRAGDDRELGLVLTGLGAALALNGEHRAAREKTLEALAVFRRNGDAWGAALALGDLGWAAFAQGDDGQARAWLEEALQLRQEIGAQWLTAQTSWHLGELYRFQGDLQRAEGHYEGCQAIAEEIQAAVWIRSARLGLGFVALAQGKQPTAARLFGDSLRLAVEQGEREGIVQALEGLTELAVRRREQETAVRLAGACDAFWQSFGLNPSRDTARRVQLVDPWLRQDGLQAIYEQGGEMTFEESLSLANEVIDTWQRVEGDVSTARHELRILALGPARVYREGRELVPADWSFAKPKELFFYLVANPPQTKEQIGSVFWPDASPTQLRQSFRTTVYHLRQALGRREWIVFDKGRYGFNRSLDYVYDVERFEAQLAQAETVRETNPGRAIHLLRETVDLYRGPFIADITLDEWALVQRQALERKFVQAMLSLGRLLYRQQAYFQAEQVYRRIIDEDALVESAHRGLMRCYAARGEPVLALRHYQDLVELLQAEMGIDPSPESRSLHARLQANDDLSRL